MILGWMWPERVFWGGSTLLAALVLLSLFLFMCGLLLSVMFAFREPRWAFNLVHIGLSGSLAPVMVFGQSGMLPSVGTEFVVLIALGGMGMGVLFILGAYRRLCEMDIG